MALTLDGSLRASATLGVGRGHAEFVAPAIEFLFEQAHAGPGDLDAVAVGIGPGLFTGMRVGIITGKLMAAALAIPIVGVSSLDLIAHQTGVVSSEVMAIVDARRGEVYWAAYAAGAGGIERQGEMRLSSPRECAESVSVAGRSHVLAGDGAVAYRSLFESSGFSRFAPGSAVYPMAEALNEIADSRLSKGVGGEEMVEPIYMRHSDAEINWDRMKREAPLERAQTP